MIIYFGFAVGVAQLVRAPGCGPGGRGFETHHSPHFSYFVTVVDPRHNSEILLIGPHAFQYCTTRIFAKVAELVDALDLGSSFLRSGGSSPPFRILFYFD